MLQQETLNPHCPWCNAILILQYGLIESEDIWQCLSCGFQCLAHMNLESV